MSGAVAIVQARMSSIRLPGKSLADVEGEPLLALLVQRLRHALEIERIVVATSTEPIDDPIEEVAPALGCDATADRATTSWAGSSVQPAPHGSTARPCDRQTVR